MIVLVNGKKQEFHTHATLGEVLKSLSLEDKVMAAAVNMQIVKQELWQDHELQEGDALELLDFVGGG